MTKKKLRFAVMGLGLQGNRLIQAIAGSHSAVLSATASEREKESFVQALKDKNIDAVVIATPNNQHAKQVVAAARAGKHVLCEKPLVLSMREARAIKQVVKKNRVHCFVNYHLRMHPEVQKAKGLIAKKKLGDLTYIEMQWSIGGLAQKNLPTLPSHMRWRENPVQAGGGALMARGVHLFDLLRFLTGQEAREVSAWSDATRTTVDRTAIGIFLLTTGIPAVITTSKSIPDADNRIVLCGTKGKLVLCDLFTADPHTMYTSVFDSFAGALRGKKTPLATLEDGIAVLAMTSAFLASAKHKRAERIM
ncbi:MAG: Gfo/Idh/MocA family oxidoreductase [Candidatus Paceibacterota bacterium]|jgi:1,5-anhydro-D-fructose reductase (1,5-anhydro-D-mannitol-forming)